MLKLIKYLFQILSGFLFCIVEGILARTISPLENNGNGRSIDVKASSLVANDEETKTLLAWLNMINTNSSPPQVDNSNRGSKAIPSIGEDNYVKKDGFIVAKAPSNVPSLLGKCRGFAFVLVGT